MKTLYKCEVCGFTSESFDSVAICEGMGKLAIKLDGIFGSDEWYPPLPLGRFKEWSHADRQEMARRIDGFSSRHYK